MAVFYLLPFISSPVNGYILFHTQLFIQSILLQLICYILLYYLFVSPYRCARLYGFIEFDVISKRAVQRIVPLPDARFPVVYRASADPQFRAYFGLPHAVHIAIQDGKFKADNCNAATSSSYLL